MIKRLPRSFNALVSEQRVVVLAAALVLVSMLLPWYSKTTNGVTRAGLSATHEAKIAIFVPSFVEASIFLVAIAILVLMFFRGEGSAFHLPFGDGLVVTAGGAWVGFLVFYRFIDQPAGGKTNNLVYSYDLSWGIFFGLLAAAFLIYAGTRLRLARVAEPPLPGEGPEAPTVADRRARRQAEREQPPPHADEAPTSVAPAPAPTVRRPARPPRAERPEIDGGTQLSFDEQE
ncbi:hypothetical protein [Baekduia sp.]|uniref:hypothetical protein n=1 Tax=Baekduia sp. TaxID=2600305 RepID=UPI002DFC043D|nr:hypothetical protein [Baekduia sp.]